MHYSAARLDRSARSAALATDAQLMARLRLRLDGTALAKTRLAASLGTDEGTLSKILRGTHPISEAIAAKLGYRRVVRFERTS